MMTGTAGKFPSQWRIVCKKLAGNLYLCHVNVGECENGAQVFKNLQQKYHHVKSSPPFHIWDTGLLLYNPIIETATLSTNSNLIPDSEVQRATRQVFVTDRKRDIELTAAFRNPELLASAKTFVTDNVRFQVGVVNGELGKEVLLIGLRMSWVGLLFLVSINLVICLGSGLAVGMATKDVNLGVAVTSGVAAVVACVQAVLFLVHK